GVALEGRRQLLRGARECAGEQRIALLYAERPAQYAEVRRRAGAAQRVAHAARRVRREEDPRDLRRQAVHRDGGRPHHGRGRRGRVDQGGQRDAVRRFRLRNDGIPLTLTREEKTDMATSTEPGPGPGYTLSQLVLYALKLGTFGFGGPVAL